jgi:hypothetical protein
MLFKALFIAAVKGLVAVFAEGMMVVEFAIEFVRLSIMLGEFAVFEERKIKTM